MWAALAAVRSGRYKGAQQPARRSARRVIRIGTVPYLNAHVLTYGLQPATERYTCESHVPSVLVRKLQDGDVDVALVSSVEYLRRPDYCIVPDISISGYREMWSVKLFHRVPLKAARRIGLEPASESSNALLQVILYEKLQLGINLVPLQVGEDPLTRGDLDGFLKIGDECMMFVPSAGYEALDLAAEWNGFTNLPFVFALWLVRKGVDLEGINTDLFLAKREGLRHVDELARAAGPQLGLDFLRAKNYITRVVHYDLGRAELAGLDLFRRYLIRLGLVPQSTGFDLYTR